MTTKRVLHVYQSPSYSGAEAYAREVALSHVEKKLDVVFLAKLNSPLAEKLKADVAAARHGKFQLATAASDIDFRNFDAVVLHSTQELKAHWPSLLKARLKSRLRPGFSPIFVIYSHIWISHSKRDPFHFLLYKLIDQFWCSSQASKKNLEALLPLSADKIRIIRYGRATELFEQSLKSKNDARSELKIPLDVTVFGTLGRVDQGKGSRELFDAGISVLQENPNSYFLMIGPPTASDPKAIALDRKLEEALQSLASSNPDLRKRILKIGRLENGSSFLSAFDLFILATYKENFALTLLEAQLAGIPCLATDSGGSPDLVQDGKTGWLFQPSSTSSLESTLRQALKEKPNWSRFGETARSRVREQYRLDQILNELDRNLGL